MIISSNDRARLRELAARQMELYASERNQRLYRDWEEYSDFSRITRPLIRFELWTFAQDILPDMMQCEGSDARRIEMQLLTPMASFTLFEDDTLIKPYFGVMDPGHFKPFSLDVKKKETSGLGHHFIPYLEVLEEDMHLLKKSEYGYDAGALETRISELSDLFGDILPVRRESCCYGACLMQNIVHIMNMDDMYIAMKDEETLWHQLMRRLTDDYKEYYRYLEENGYLMSSARAQHLSQGTYCFTNELPDDKCPARLTELWSYFDSQETAGISPEMYRDLVFPYYKELMELHGLTSYGCCEATDPIRDDCLSTIKNLRKVSISPWCNEEKMGEVLRGKGITYLRKPFPTLIGVEKELNEDKVRDAFRKTTQAARGCRLEVAVRDVYTVHKNPAKVKRFVEIAREEMEKQQL